MERNFPCMATQNDASSVRELLKTAKYAMEKFRLGDSQVMSLLVSRAEGALQRLLLKELSRQTPLDNVFAEIQVTLAEAENKITSERKVLSFKKTKQGIRKDARNLLEYVRVAS